MSSDCASSSSSGSDDEGLGERIEAHDGLSGDVLAALLEFQSAGGRFADDDDEAADAAVFTRDTLCAAYRPEDTAVIAETMRRLQDREHGTSSSDGAATEVPLNERVVELLQVPPPLPLNDESSNAYNDTTTTNDTTNLTALQRDGVVRINNALTAEQCAACLNFVNEALLKQHHCDLDADDVATGAGGFGNVFERNNRFDMYLRDTGVIADALHQLLSASTQLGQLFQQLLVSDGGVSSTSSSSSNSPNVGCFHELSSLVADPGCIAQPIHPDAPYADQAPLWTCFVALQGIDADMGGTVFLPGTHTAAFHDQLKSSKSCPAQERTRWLNECSYKRADLAAGDCAVMDARTLHYGGANTSDTRRVLLYFTIRNPTSLVLSADSSSSSPYPDCGSLFPDLDGVLTTATYIV
jgi:hypothetical protein